MPVWLSYEYASSYRISLQTDCCLAECWRCYILNVPKYIEKKQKNKTKTDSALFWALFKTGAEVWDFQEVEKLASACVRITWMCDHLHEVWQRLSTCVLNVIVLITSHIGFELTLQLTGVLWVHVGHDVNCSCDMLQIHKHSVIICDC